MYSTRTTACPSQDKRFLQRTCVLATDDTHTTRAARSLRPHLEGQAFARTRHRLQSTCAHSLPTPSVHNRTQHMALRRLLIRQHRTGPWDNESIPFPELFWLLPMLDVRNVIGTDNLNDVCGHRIRLFFYGDQWHGAIRTVHFHLRNVGAFVIG